MLVGLGALTRSEIALYAVGFAGLAWWRAAGHPRRALLPVLVVGAAALTVAPWTLYNVARFERPVLLSTNDGTTLLGANCDSTYYVDIGGWDIRCLVPVPTDDSIDASVRSVERRDLAVDYVGDHLGRLPVVVAARLGRIVDVYGLQSLVALDRGEEKAEWAVWVGIVGWWLLAVRVVAGWVVLGRPGRRIAGADPGAVVAGRADRRGARHDGAVLRRPPHPGPGRTGGRRPRRRRGRCGVGPGPVTPGCRPAGSARSGRSRRTEAVTARRAWHTRTRDRPPRRQAGRPA